MVQLLTIIFTVLELKTQRMQHSIFKLSLDFNQITKEHDFNFLVPCMQNSIYKEM